MPKHFTEFMYSLLIHSAIPIMKEQNNFIIKSSAINKFNNSLKYLNEDKHLSEGGQSYKRKVEMILKTYNPIRDRYFTKDGVLNFNKKRVQDMLLEHKINIKPVKVKMKPLVKKVIKPKVK